MKVKVGYITSWRKAIFFALILFLLLFGFARSISFSLIGPGVITNVVSLLAFLVGGVAFAYVCFGGRSRFEGEGQIDIKDGKVSYHDKKRHFDVRLKDIKKIDIQPLMFRKQGGNTLAYQVIVATNKKTYYIESEFVADQTYDQVDLYKLYLYLQEKNNER